MFKVAAYFILLFVMIGEVEAMQISFFEEYPDDGTAEKVSGIDFDTRIYVAARNLSAFYSYEAQFKEQNGYVEEVIYWPVLKKEEGYWISPWSDSEALLRVFQEITERKDKRELEVLLDLEPSLQRSRLLRFKNFNQNKEQIGEFIKKAKDHNVSISTVEKSYISESALELLGLSFAPEEYGNKKIKMYYSSYRRRFLPDFAVNKLFERKIQRYAEEGVQVGLGLIAPGIHDEKHYITPEILENELKIASDYGIKEVVIFRLEGLNEEYVKVLEKFV